MTDYKPYDYKAFVTGPYQSGKTHLIRALDPTALSIEKPMSKPHRGKLGTTTTCFDLGRIVWLRNGHREMVMSRCEYRKRKDEFREWIAREIELRGVPGSLQFKAIRDAMRADSDLVLMVVDSSDRTMIDEAKKILEETRAAHGGTYIEVIANKQDVSEAASPEEVASWLGVQRAIGISSTDHERCSCAIVETLRKLEKSKSPKNS